MRKSTIGLTVFTSALLSLAFAPSVSVAQGMSWIMTVGARDGWKNTYCINTGQPTTLCSGPGGGGITIVVKPGDYLVFNATGHWKEGSTISGPGGLTRLWPDNFLNLTDLGVGPYQAHTLTPQSSGHYASLVGYIGNSPPERGSYASPKYTTAVGEQAQRVFPIFNTADATFSAFQATQGGLLWLIFNADAYSNYIADNSVDSSDTVTVTILQDQNWRPTANVEPFCKLLEPFKMVEMICSGASMFVDVPIAR